MQIDTLIAARWIIPVEPAGQVLEHHALAIRAGRIVDILPQPAANGKYRPAETVRLDEHALIPGLVNAHTHAPMTLMRGIADDVPLMQWLKQFIWPLEQQWVGEAFVRDGTELALAEMLRGGTTCFNDMYFFPETAAEVVQRAGIRACIGLIVVDFPNAWAADADRCIEKGLALHTALQDRPLLHPVLAPHAPYSVADSALIRLRGVAQRLELPIHMHIHETADEIEQSLSTHGMRPLERLQQLGLVTSGLLAVHMTQLTDDEISGVAKRGASVIHCPESNLKLASGFCPVKRLLDAGVNVALGTDSAASNNDLDLLGEMKTAALLAKGVAADAAAVPAHTALQMATLNGARALGIDAETGSLALGKSADITAIRLDPLETRPLYDAASQIVYAASRDQVSDVWVAGRRLLASRTLTTLSEPDLQTRIGEWGTRLNTSRQECTA